MFLINPDLINRPRLIRLQQSIFFLTGIQFLLHRYNLLIIFYKYRIGILRQTSTERLISSGQIRGVRQIRSIYSYFNKCGQLEKVFKNHQDKKTSVAQTVPHSTLRSPRRVTLLLFFLTFKYFTFLGYRTVIRKKSKNNNIRSYKKQVLINFASRDDHKSVGSSENFLF